jgi:DNA-directed RNA polymerase subunit H (RpoH/RPB5)
MFSKDIYTANIQSGDLMDYKRYINLCHMFRDRKYKISDKQFLALKNFEKQFSETLYIYLIDEDKKNIGIFRKNQIVGNFNKKDYILLLDFLKNLNLDKGEVRVNVFIKGFKLDKRIKNYEKTVGHFTFKFYTISIISICIPKHSYVPKHILLGRETKLPVSKSSLPKIREDDPISIWYDAKPGDVFKIIRKYKDDIIDMVNSINTGNNPNETIYREVIKKYEV